MTHSPQGVSCIAPYSTKRRGAYIVQHAACVDSTHLTAFHAPYGMRRAPSRIGHLGHHCNPTLPRCSCHAAYRNTAAAIASARSTTNPHANERAQRVPDRRISMWLPTRSLMGHCRVLRKCSAAQSVLNSTLKCSAAQSVLSGTHSRVASFPAASHTNRAVAAVSPCATTAPTPQPVLSLEHSHHWCIADTPAAPPAQCRTPHFHPHPPRAHAR